ncbi:MAG: OprO/OprP family phosphate-selective porin [Planctomycetota bacterium]|nr:OprO/OprP family phosphate-selective porin [Planctomycetota bacterium]
MSFIRRGFGILVVLTLVTACGLVRAGSSGNDVTQAEYDQLKKELEDLKRQLDATTPIGPRSTAVDNALDNKYGPDANVTTRSGRLTIGGLLQVWYYSIQNDNHGWVDADQLGSTPGGTGWGSNEVADNDSFRVRRSELRFTMDIHENITAYVSIDPAREATSFPTFPTNVGSGISGDSAVFYNAGVNSFGGGAVGPQGHIRNPQVRSGSGEANRALQDAYINYHGAIPHHDFTVGQFKRHLGEEGTRDSKSLDFTERAMITQLADLRDLGIQVHGSWWDERFQYWIGGFDGAGTAFQQRQNRANDTDNFDLVAAVLLRPLWQDEKWGSIEIGYSFMGGNGGDGGNFARATASPYDGLQRRETYHSLMYAYGMWKAGSESPVRGWWVRGEWGRYRDRFGPTDVAIDANGVLAATFDPATFSVQGWYVSMGYNLGESVFADDVGGWVKPMEFVFRYDVMENLFYSDLDNPTRELDVFKTQVITAGINYYIKGHNAKIQLNYNWVNEDDDSDSGAGAGSRQTREVRNDNLVLNFQVGW